MFEIRLQSIPADEPTYLGPVSFYREFQSVLESELLVTGLQYIREQLDGWYLESVALSTSEHASWSQAQATHGREEHPFAESQEIGRPHTAIAIGQNTEPFADSR
jgi:hypothetical protein